MHQLLATLFALLVALCHHTTLTARSMEASEVRTAMSLPGAGDSPSTIILPDRYQFAHPGSGDGYADVACPSCVRTNASFIVR